MRSARLPALLFIALGLAGSVSSCTWLKETIGLGPRRPKVTVTEVAVTKASLVMLELSVKVMVENPNSFDLVVNRLRYQMVAADLEIARGIHNARVTVPGEGRSTVQLPLTIDARNVMKLARDLLSKKDDVLTVMTATAEIDTPLGAMDVDFEDKRPLRKLVNF